MSSQKMLRLLEKTLAVFIALAVYMMALVAAYKCEAAEIDIQSMTGYVSEIAYADGIYILEVETEVKVNDGIQYEYYQYGMKPAQFQSLGFITIGSELNVNFTNTQSWYTDWVIVGVSK